MLRRLVRGVADAVVQLLHADAPLKRLSWRGRTTMEIFVNPRRPEGALYSALACCSFPEAAP